MKIEMDLQGADELIDVLNRAGGKTAKQANQVIKNNAEKGMAIAKQKAPVDTGFLKENIVTEYKPNEAVIHSRAGYSGYQEFGTRFMNAQPFMRPMMTELQPILLKDLMNVMGGAFAWHLLMLFFVMCLPQRRT